MTDVELDERVTALEENSGSGGTNGKINDDLHTLFLCLRLLRYRNIWNKCPLCSRNHRLPHHIDIIFYYPR